LNWRRYDLDAILELVPPQARVLDLGCGEGLLLEQMVREKQVVARGVELSEENVRACIGRGLSVRQGNIEEGLADYSNGAFDFVILSQTLAYLDHPQPVVQEMLRVGRRAIISFDNAGFWKIRWRALWGRGVGPTLISREPRARAITLSQFLEYAVSLEMRVEQSLFLARGRRVKVLPAVCAEGAVYMITTASQPRNT
jgi:methionine biosynthesis protein MetW